MTERSPVYQIAADLEAQLHDGLKTAIHKQKPMNAGSIWASRAGHPCARYLYNLRMNMEQASEISVQKFLLFQDGKVHEEQVKEVLRSVRIRVVETQVRFAWQRWQISGKIDGKVEIEYGHTVPFEVKAYGFEAKRIHTVQDFLLSSKYWARMAPYQLSLYIAMNEEERKRQLKDRFIPRPYGLFIIKDKVSSEVRIIPYELRPELVKEAQRQANIVNRHVRREVPPPRMEYDYRVCDGCEFNHICLPDSERPMPEIGDEKLRDLLEEWYVTKKAKNRHQLLHEQIRGAVKGKPDILTPRFRITGKPNKHGEWRTRIDPLFFDEPEDETVN